MRYKLNDGILSCSRRFICRKNGEAVALAKAQMKSADMLARESGIVARTERVIMEPGTYPRAWKMAEKTSGP